MALTRFKRSLKWVRASVRGFTHTLHLPPAQAGIYERPPPEWLRTVLVELPNLQSLVVPELPFFDHSSLVSLRTYRHNNSAAENIRPSFALRLLVASQCTNTTPRSLADGLTTFPQLVFLDLSRTSGTRDAVVLSKLRHMESLQILKLCGIQLRDNDVEVLADSIGIRVRSLDVRNNLLTDESLQTLLHTCFRTLGDNARTNGYRPRGLSVVVDEDWPSGLLKPDPAVLDEFQDESFDERQFNRLTRGMINRMPSEDQPHAGITHLYIADNQLTVEGVSSLIRSTRLHVLDVGSVCTARHFRRPNLQLPGAETLTPVLATYARETLTSLRVDHSLVTKSTRLEEETEPDSCELSSDSMHRGFDGPAPDYEPADNQAERFGLTGDSVPKPEDKGPPAPLRVRPDSIDAPEVVEDHGGAVKDVSVPTAAGLGPVAQAINDIHNPASKDLGPGNAEISPMSSPSLDLGHSTISIKRQDVRSNQNSRPHGLLPNMLPQLRSLTLTDVPCYDDSGEVVDALIRFIRHCASETELAKLQIDLQSNDLRPGRASSYARKSTGRVVEDIFALGKITLEMSSANTFSPTQVQSGTRWAPQPSTSRTRSSTEDADSEAFWAAQEKDFSFFDDDDECGLPSVEPKPLVQPGPHFPISTLSKKDILLPDSTNSSSAVATLQQQPIKAEPERDVVQELSRFRRDRKAAYEQARKQGQETVEGYWPGEVKVVRRPGGKVAATVDYYDKYLQKGRGSR